MTAEVIRMGALAMQVCVPVDWTDEQVKAFADRKFECGTQHGWGVCKPGDRLLDGDDDRVRCTARVGHVHIVLAA